MQPDLHLLTLIAGSTGATGFKRARSLVDVTAGRAGAYHWNTSGWDARRRFKTFKAWTRWATAARRDKRGSLSPLHRYAMTLVIFFIVGIARMQSAGGSRPKAGPLVQTDLRRLAARQRTKPTAPH